MKINYYSKAMGLFLLLTIATPAFPASNDIIAESKEAKAIHLQNRLEEIKAIDKKELSRDEKKALRHEVKEIKKELAAISGGVYLSIGAILLIALLLILLL
ncbi:MAG: hypothetical protein WA874_06365 [Chryseosolibacter sp.]